MKFTLGISLALLIIKSNPFSVEGVEFDDCSLEDVAGKYFSSDGDLIISAILNIHENCSTIEQLDIEYAINLITIIGRLNRMNYLPGITIGFNLYDCCFQPESANQAIISYMIEKACSKNQMSGILTTSWISKSVNETAIKLNVTVLNALPKLSSGMKFESAAYFLKTQSIHLVDNIIATNDSIAKAFSSLLNQNGICVKKISSLSDELCEIDVHIIVFIAYWDEVISSFKLHQRCESTFIIILLDDSIESSKIEALSLMKNSFVILESTADKEHVYPPDFLINNDTTDLDEFNFTTTVTTIQTATTILSIVDDFYTQCSQLESCLDTDQFRYNLSVNTIEEIDTSVVYNVTKALKLENEEIPPFYNVYKLEYPGEVIFFGDLTPIEGQWYLRADENVSEINVFCNQNINASSCQCNDTENEKSIFAFLFFNQLRVKLRSDMWVASVLTLSVIGIVGYLAIGVFLLSRLTNKETLEGNPTLSILMVICGIATYVSVTPFCLEARNQTDVFTKGIICTMKMAGSGLSYTLLFSIMLSRSLMILLCDNEGGFMSHIDGYLQSSLCFFMILTEVALITEFAAINWIYSKTNMCEQLSNYLFHSWFNGALLCALVVVTPFVAKSKRNYREGFYFAIASVTTSLVWVVWCYCCYVLDSRWHDCFVAYGLCVTSTIVLTIIFIPRTYLTMSGIFRDQLVGTLPSNYAARHTELDTKYRSTRTLYDAVEPDSLKGHVNMGFYSLPNRNESQISSRGAPTIESSESESGSVVATAASERLTSF